MSLRGLLVAAVLAAVLGGAAYWSVKAKKEDTATTDAAPKLATVKEEALGKIEIHPASGETTVVQKEKVGGWEITSPRKLRVDEDAVKSLVSAYTNLSWDRVIEEKATDVAAYGLKQPSLEIVFQGQDKTQKLLIGDETPTGGGYFAKLEGDPRVFTVPSGTKTSLEKNYKELRDKRLLTFNTDKLTRVQLNSKGQMVEFGKDNNNEWQIIAPRPLRAEGWAIDELVRKLKEARMDATLSEEELKKAAASFTGASRVATATVTDNSGTQQIEIRKSGDDYYARSSVVDGVYKVTKDLGDGPDKGLEDFRNKKLFDFGFTEPTKVEMRAGDKFHSFVKGGEKWWSNGKEVDSTGVQSVIDKLRDLSATKFVDSGFTRPDIEITVTSNDGKRVEKVQISKTAASYFAKRENEPSIYELDAKAVEDLQRAAADVKPPPQPAAKK